MTGLNQFEKELLIRIVKAGPDGIPWDQADWDFAKALEEKELLEWGGTVWFATPKGCSHPEIAGQ